MAEPRILELKYDGADIDIFGAMILTQRHFRTEKKSSIQRTGSQMFVLLTVDKGDERSVTIAKL